MNDENKSNNTIDTWNENHKKKRERLHSAGATYGWGRMPVGPDSDEASEQPGDTEDE